MNSVKQILRCSFFLLFLSGVLLLSENSFGGELQEFIQNEFIDGMEFLDVENFDSLLSRTKNINETDKDGKTPLHLLTLKCKTCAQAALLMIKRGANVRARDKDGNIPLHYFYEAKRMRELRETLSEMRDNNDFIDILLKNGSDINTRNNHGDTPLITALSWPYLNGSSECRFWLVKKLIDAGANVNVQNKEGHYPLYLAAIWSFGRPTVRLLLKAGADVNLQTKDGQNSLYLYILYGNIESVRLLIQAGAKINHRDKKGQTPLMYASEAPFSHYSTVELIRLLVKSGAKVNEKDKEGKTALIYAVMQGSSSSVNALLEAGANPFIHDEFDKTALDYAEEKLAEENKFYYDVIYYLKKYQNKIMNAEKSNSR